MNELTDPTVLADRTDVEYVEAAPEVNDSHYEAYESVAGTVVVGIVDPDGRLALLEHDQIDGLRPSFTRVDEGGDYVAAAVDIARDSTGLDVEIDSPLRLRRHVYRTEDGRETTGYDVVFVATPVGDGAIDPEAGHDWRPSWHDPATVEVDVGGKAGSDLRVLLDAA